MSKFSAINLSDDESDLEEHTRELQIEESLKLFKKLLNYQKDKDFANAFDTYEDLFKIDVISDFSPSTTTVSNLRYLSYRNRGFLKLDKLLKDQHERELANITVSSDSDLFDTLYDDLMSCLEDFVTALVFGQGDTKLVEVIYEFFQFFENKRLTRFILEYELMKNDISMGNESNLLVLRRQKFSPTFCLFLNRYKDLVTSLSDYDSILANPDTFISRNNITISPLAKPHDGSQKRDLSFLQPLKDEIVANQYKNLYIPREVTVDFSRHEQVNISTVLKEIQRTLPKPKTRLKRFFDHYYSTDEPIEILKLDVTSGFVETVENVDEEDVKEPEKEEDVEMEEESTPPDVKESPEHETEPVDKEETTNSATGSAAGSSIQERKRSSRRLNLVSSTEEPKRLQDHNYADQARFFALINNYLELVDKDISMVDVTPVMKDAADPDKDVFLHDFAEILETWNHARSELLLLDVSDKKNIGVMEILNAGSVDESLVDDCEDINVCDVSALISLINNTNLHLYQVRIKILEFVLKEMANGSSLIIDYKFGDDSAFQDLKHFINCSDVMLYSSLKDSLETSKDNVSVVLGIFEVLVDSYINIYLEMELLKSQDSGKPVPSEYLVQKRILSHRIERWKSLLEDLIFKHGISGSKLYLRFEWADLTYLQHTDNLTEANELNIKQRLSKLLSQRPLKRIDIKYANYSYIKNLNYRAVEVQLSKLNILTHFSDIFRADSENLDTVHKKNNMDLLEKMVLPKPGRAKNKSKEEKDMQQFITNSSLELKLKLFQVLLNHFKDTNQIDKFQNCVEHVISLLHSTMTLQSAEPQSVTVRQQSLVRMYAFFGEFIDKYLQVLVNNDWTISKLSSSKATLELLLDFMRLGYIFCLHEDLAKEYSQKISILKKSAKSFAKLKDIIANLFSLFFIYYELFLEDKKPVYINDLLDILHDELGRRGMCESGDGRFLKLIQDTLISLGWIESERDILQLIACRYKLQISVDGFVPFEHNTTGILFDKENALEISKYVIPICFKKRNPIVNNIRSDIKSLLDSIYEAVGDPDEESESIARCTALLEDYLDNTVLNVKVMRSSFYGLNSLELKPGKLNLQVAIDNGLYYLQGVNSLNLFKLRKRSMQSRISELDFVIKMFKQDLYCGSERLESWLLLGQAYGFLVEDDLIWTSDKLTNEDKKETTALLQKKSLLCYLMAINQYTLVQDKSQLKLISAQLWSGFAKELYNATMEPMNKLCFGVNGMPRFFKDKSQIVEAPFSNPVSDKTLLKTLKSSFLMAVKHDEKDWMGYYYLAKLEHKTSNDPEAIAEFLLQSSLLAKSVGSHSDPTIEPHYLLCSIMFKLVSQDKLSVPKAVQYLSEDRILKVPAQYNDINDRESLAKLVIDCLKQLINLDKKNWHHKPHFRMAKIYMDVFHDVEAAKLEMLGLINLKSTVKNLVTIWKPEHERPGKHFSYNFQYVMFTIDILNEAKDLTSMLALGRKLRRYGASIVKILTAWGHATKTICDLIRKFAGIENNYSERIISTLPYSIFMKKAKEMNQYLNGKGSKFDKEEHQNLLYLFTEFAEIKRMSNGFSQTAYIDDTFYCIYLKMLSIYRSEIQQLDEEAENRTAVPYDPSVKSKLAKRDIAEIIKSLSLPKLPEKPPTYVIRDPATKEEKENTETISEVAEEKEVKTENTPDVIEVEQDVKSETGSVENAAVVISSDEEGTPGPKKRSVSIDPETPHKKLKLSGDNTSGEEEFHTPRKSFDDEDEDDVIEVS